jgi:hypothetical protein
MWQLCTHAVQSTTTWSKNLCSFIDHITGNSNINVCQSSYHSSFQKTQQQNLLGSVGKQCVSSTSLQEDDVTSHLNLTERDLLVINNPAFGHEDMCHVFGRHREVLI